MTEMTTPQTETLPVPVKKKKKGILSKILLVMLLIVIFIAVFFYGILIGAMHGGKLGNFNLDRFSVNEYVVDFLRNSVRIDYELTLTEKELNTLLVSYENNFKPLRNIYAAPKDGYVVFSAQLTAESIEESYGADIPDVIWLFLPSVLNIKAEVELKTENGQPRLDIRSVALLNTETGGELLTLSGFDDILQALINDVLEEVLPNTLTFKDISVTETGIAITGDIALLSDE